MMILLAAILACPPSSPNEPPACAYFGVEGCICCDWNESGEIDADDLAEFITDAFAGEPCADIDLSGQTDWKDLDLYLTRYFGA